MATPLLLPFPDAATALRDPRFDSVVLVSPRTTCGIAAIDEAASTLAAVDARVGSECLLVPADLPGGRLILAPTGPLGRDFDDVRRFADAARHGLLRARAAGSTAPLILLAGAPSGWERVTEVALLGGLGGLWEPLEAREAIGEEACEPVRHVGFVGDTATATTVSAIEAGRRLSRDLGGTEPERMRPEMFVEQCRQAFVGTPVDVELVEDLARLRASYPLLMAVARASVAVKRHQPKVLRLILRPEGPVERTLLLAGKGVTYDTGGHDLKTGGHMAGMSRDKGGAASVAGLLRTLAQLRPAGLQVVAELGLVRNSIGSDAFVTDEIIRGHSGCRVRIGNTDAEGRLVLADLLSNLREVAAGSPNPHVMSVATLTGHSMVAVGAYSIAIDNGPARDFSVAERIDAAGARWGDPFEISRLRRDDYDFVRPRSRADDVLSCNNKPSSATPRGHQFPMAFLDIASGLVRHGRDGDKPIAYTHIDLGGSYCEGMDWQHGRPTAAPVAALATWAAEL
jgi:leucyl aminopeptidase